MSKTRFDFEQEIMNCWSIVDDLKIVRHALLEGDASTDSIDNMLLGLTELYQVKFDIMFQTFESLVSTRQLNRGLGSMGGSVADPDPNQELSELRNRFNDAENDEIDLDGRC